MDIPASMTGPVLDAYNATLRGDLVEAQRIANGLSADEYAVLFAASGRAVLDGRTAIARD